MKNVFISQRMKNISNDEIELNRKLLMELAKREIPDDLHFIESFDPKAEDEYNAAQTQIEKDRARIRALGRAIQTFADVDVVVFEYDGVWDDSFGCRVEKMLVDKYKIESIIAEHYNV